MKNLTLRISGMACAHCVKAVEDALTALPGVSAAKVQLGQAEITFEPANVTAEQMIEAIKEQGYGIE